MLKINLIASILFIVICCPSGANTLMSIDAIFNQPQSAFFTVSRDSSGRWSCGDDSSYYASQISGHEPVFTVGNGAFTAAVDPNGRIDQTCVFGSTEPRISPWAGGWFGCRRYITSSMGFKLLIGGAAIDPSTDWPCRTSYLANILPLTEYNSATLQIKTVVCPPITTDGAARPRGVIWSILIRNISSSIQSGTLLLSMPDGFIISNTKDQATDFASTRTDYALAPHEEQLIHIVAANKGDEAALSEISSHETTWWLNQTCSYWRRVTGEMSMPDDPFTAEMFIRKTITCLQSGVFDQKGAVADVLPGTFPFETADNAKDFYYTILPAAQRDPKLLQPFIAWFAHNAIRPPEPKYPGGISSSLGNSLNAALLAGLYFDATNDSGFFKSHPELIKSLTGLFEQILKTRNPSGPWLFPSSYISDGRSLGDFHTGSNICAWRAFSSFSRILDACGDKANAERYVAIAANIRKDIDSHNIVSGPYGQQYIEGTYADGSAPVMIHDGEESDTTLMPFYGYCGTLSQPFQNDMKFAASTNNVAFNSETRGIEWENYGPNPVEKSAGPHVSDATFPGYVTALAGCTADSSLRGKEGDLTEMRRLTDVNGMWWWWPYKFGAPRGQVVRFPFECGWADGSFAAMFQSNFLGISYDAPSQIFRCSPIPAVGNFTWKNFPFGNDHFSVTYRNGTVLFTNLTNHKVKCAESNDNQVIVRAGQTISVEIGR